MSRNVSYGRTAGKGRIGVVTGVKEIDRVLKKLAPAVQKKQMRKALRVGAKVIQAQAKVNASTTFKRRSGEMVRNIKVRSGKTKTRGRIAIDVRVGAGDFKGRQFYAAFHEFGTSREPARPFMKPAFAAKGPEASDVVLRALKAGVDVEVENLRGS